MGKIFLYGLSVYFEVCVYVCVSVCECIENKILEGRIYGLIAYPLRWNMLLNDVVHLSKGYSLSIFLSRKENSNKLSKI